MLLDDVDLKARVIQPDSSQSRERTWIWYNVLMAGLAFCGLACIHALSIDFPFSKYSVVVIFLGIGMNVGYWLVALAESFLKRFLHTTPQLLTWIYFGLSLVLNIYFLFTISIENQIF